MLRRSFVLASALSLGLGAVATQTLSAHAAAPASGHPARPAAVGGRDAPSGPGALRRRPSALGAGRLVHTGTAYTKAQTTFPSDSFPGMIAQLTGGGAGHERASTTTTPTTTPCCPPGTTRLQHGSAPGTEVSWTEAADRSQNPITLDAGQGLDRPGARPRCRRTRSRRRSPTRRRITAAILQMTPTPQTLLDPAALPVDPATCLPVYPHQYLRVNTVFEVARAHGLRTAWSDKHPAYEILNGPSGTGIAGPVHARDQQRRRRRRRRLDDRQRADPGVRRHQGRGRAQRDRRHATTPARTRSARRRSSG